MTKWNKRFLGLIIILMISMILASCSGSKGTGNSGTDLLNTNWNTVEKQAKGQTVNLYMWGGSDSINKYIDEWVAPRLEEQSDVTLNRVPMNDTKDIINKLITEKQATKKEGTIDIMWINGENFEISKESDLLFGSFASKLPNAQAYVDMDSPDIANDFGIPKGWKLHGGKHNSSLSMTKQR